MPIPRYVKVVNVTARTVTINDLGLAASGGLLDAPPGVETQIPREVWIRQRRRHRSALREVGPTPPPPAPEPAPEAPEIATKARRQRRAETE